MIGDGMDVKKDSVSGLLHHKYMIIDADNPRSDPIVITGSHNWTAAADSSNDENTLIIHDANVANEFYQEFRARYGASSNISPADATIVPLTCSTNEVINITITAKHNDSSTDNVTKVYIYVPNSWSPTPSSSNTVVKRKDGHYYNLSTDVNFNTGVDGTWVELTCPVDYEILSASNGGSDSNGKNAVEFIFTNYTAPGVAGPTVFSTEVDWDSNPNYPELVETTPSPVITIRAGVVVVNEVYFNGDNTTDWVEIYCADGGPVNIQNWYLTRYSDTDTPADKIKIFPDITLDNGDFVLLHWNPTPPADDSSDAGDGIWDMYTSNGQLIATDEQVVLYDNNDRIVDACPWAEHGDTTFRTGETDDFTILIDNYQWEDYAVIGVVETTDFLNSDLIDTKPTYSFARKNDGFDNNQKEDWIIEASPTPGVGNAVLPQLVINEVCYYGSTSSVNYFRGQKLDWDWVEIYCVNDTNNGNGINLNGYLLMEQNGGAGDEYTLPNVTIKTGEYIMVIDTTGTSDTEAQDIDKTLRLYTGGSLLALSSGDSHMTLKDASGHILDFVCWADYTCSFSAGTTDFDTAQENGEWANYPVASCVDGISSSDDRENDAVCIYNDGTNGSIARNSVSNDTNDKVDWTMFLNGDPTPGAPNCTPNPSGTMSVSPNKVRPSTSYDFTFTFQPESEPVEMYYIVVPSTFGDPNGWTIDLSGSDNGIYTVGTYGASIGGGTAILVSEFDGDYLQTGTTSALTFSNITSPAALGGYTFTSGAKVVGEFPYEVANSPVITVLDAIILINEVQMNGSTSGSGYYEDHDWVELYIQDVGGAGIDISTFIITDVDGTDTAFALSPVTVHTGDYVLVHWIVGGTDETDAAGDLNGNGIVDLYVDDTNLTGTDDQAALVNGAVYYDSVCWMNNDGTWSEAGDVQTLVTQGQWLIKGGTPTEWDGLNSKVFSYSDSMVRLSTASDNDNLYDWSRTTTQTPGAANVFTYDGTGVLKVSDTVVTYSYDLNSNIDVGTGLTKWKFMFIPQSPISNGTVKINILPVADGWTAPTAGMLSISVGDGVSAGTPTVSGNIITIPTVTMSQNDTFVLTYGKDSDVTVGTKAYDNEFPFGTQITTAFEWTQYYGNALVDLDPLAGERIIAYSFDGGMIAGETETISIALVDVYGNTAFSFDPNANCGVRIAIDDGVGDATETIVATTLGTPVFSGGNTIVNGTLVSGTANIQVIDTQPSTGNTPRYLTVTAVDSPDILTGGSDTTTLTIYPPVQLWRAYSVITSTSSKYRTFNAEFNCPIDDDTIGNTINYTLRDKNDASVGISSVYMLTDDIRMRIVTQTDLVPGATYRITVPNFIEDGLGEGTTIYNRNTSAVFQVPYDTGINIAANSVNYYGNTESDHFRLFPEWNPTGTSIAYIGRDPSGVANIYTLSISDTTNMPVKITEDTEAVVHFSQIDWGVDGYIYYSALAAGSSWTRLYRRASDGSGNAELMSVGFWHNWFDPDYCPSNKQPGSVPRVVVSVGGDLFAFNPNDLPPQSNPKAKMIQITELSDEYNSSSSRCLQPKWWWSPDAGYPDLNQLKLVFVYESRTSNETQIYIINDVEDIISTAIAEDASKPSNVITSLADPRVTLVTHAPGDPNSTANTLPKWSPSFSVGNNENGTIVSYVQDQTGLFDNSTFNTYPNGIQVNASLASTNFDTYMTHWDDPKDAGDNTDINYIPQIITNNPYNEAFMKWAPAGGDKITFMTRQADGKYRISVVPITVNASVGPGGGLLFDNGFTSVDVPAGALTGDTVLSVNPPFDPPEVTDPRLLEIGEVREFYADGQGITFNEPVTMVIHYADADQDGYVDGTTVNELYLKVWYYDENATPPAWILIGGEVDPLANTLTIQTDHFSTYGIFGSKQPNNFTLNTLRTYPNPFRPNDEVAKTGTKEGGIVFDRLPDDVKEISIYNIVGDKVATMDSAVKYYKSHILTELPYGETYVPEEHGAVAVWKGENDKGKRVASGVYIYVIRTESGETKTGKIAIIW